ncbi:glycosyltransferase [Amycolatopsis sp. DG1A-15b]|uniref:glycosyltransferase n=1 Tax=Amycolatopsis sp. DG1A-15b TaxID=3052846 RepID=UPI00255C21FC|nr:glycosyltransferase [Amycolatopsis sp. DG1A-15b]WIX86937.1 glycosyltransferase [Amycolatopsis sp. DG1A-15b]
MSGPRPGQPGPRSAACTVVTRDRLAAAEVLAASYRAHHPGHDFVLLVADGDTAAGDLGLDPDEYFRLVTCHAGADLADVLRPLLLAKLLDRFDVVVLLDPDVEVHAPFEDVTRLAGDHGLVAAAALLAPLPQDGLEPEDVPGVFDGFLAAGQAARPFLEHWAGHARRRPPHRTGADRRWPELAAGPFDLFVVRDPGLAVGYWNLHERRLAGDPPTVSGRPLRFFAFRGFDPERPWLLTGDCPERPRVRLSTEPVLRRLCEAYRDRLGPAEPAENRFATLPDGSPLTVQMRQLYHEAWLRTERARHAPDPLDVVDGKLPPHPFGDDGGRAFRQWLAEPASPIDAATGLTRLAAAVWLSRVDLQAVFPHPRGANADGFRQWCATHGVREGLLPSWALPAAPPPPVPPVDDFGVNVVGYLTAGLGLGEMARVVRRAIAAAGVPTVSVVEEHSLAGSVHTGLATPDDVGAPRFGVSLLTVNSDFTRLILDSHPDAGAGRYRIGLWAWELEDFPAAMHDGFALVDEIWTPSEFATRAIAAHSPVPVRTIPVPVPDPGPVAREPGATTQFLFIFDFNSTGGRKNPWGVVDAFRRAFPGRDDVRLVLKATSGHRNTPAVERLRRAIGDDPRIELVERYLTAAELDDLYAGTDAYVSLHRSEGFGLTVAEAMVRGLPVIATDYSSTTEFFGPGHGWPIPCTMTDVGPGWPPYHPGGRWAEPDLDAAAAAMRAVADDPTEARRRGQAAREHVLRTRSTDAAASWMRDRLASAHRTWLARRAPEPPRHPLVAHARRLLRPVRAAARKFRVAP